MVPGPDGPLYITSQQEVKQRHGEALALRLSTHCPLPLPIDPLWFELGLLGTSPAAQSILQGTYQYQQRWTYTHSS